MKNKRTTLVGLEIVECKEHKLIVDEVTFNSSSKNSWTWERVYKMGRQSTDGGVRTFCERLAANISKGIPLTEHNIQQLNRLKD